MKPFTSIEAIGLPLDIDNVDTDQIIPARFLNRKRGEGLAQFCFWDVRYDEDGNQRAGVTLNDERYADAKVMVGGAIFGSGSSRESAVWALADEHETVRPSGMRSIIAASFGDIFFNNACKNGVVPVRLAESDCALLRAQLHEHPGAKVGVDLEKQEVRFPGGEVRRFEIDEFQKTCLLQGVDDIDLTQKSSSEIEAFERRYYEKFPWYAPGVEG